MLAIDLCVDIMGTCSWEFRVMMCNSLTVHFYQFTQASDVDFVATIGKLHADSTWLFRFANIADIHSICWKSSQLLLWSLSHLRLLLWDLWWYDLGLLRNNLWRYWLNDRLVHYRLRLLYNLGDRELWNDNCRLNLRHRLREKWLRLLDIYLWIYDFDKRRRIAWLLGLV